MNLEFKKEIEKIIKIITISGLTFTLGACGSTPKTVEVVQPATPAPTVTPEATPEVKEEYITFNHNDLSIARQMSAVDNFTDYQKEICNKEVTIEEINEMLRLFRQKKLLLKNFGDYEIEALTREDTYSEDGAFLIKSRLEKEFIFEELKDENGNSVLVVKEIIKSNIK